MVEINTTEIVYRDLSDGYAELMEEKESPILIRKKFKSFVHLAQQLTAMMRKEYHEKTGNQWNAGDFGGWNEVSDLFKEIRNADEHEAPILINVELIQSTSISKIFPEHTDDGSCFYIGSTMQLNPFSDDFPVPFSLIPADPHTGKPSDEIIEPDYVIQNVTLKPTTNKVKMIIEMVGYDDLYELSRQYYMILQSYYTFYVNCLNKTKSN